MVSLKQFFIKTPKDLKMQTLSVDDIARLMARSENIKRKLPKDFARKVHMICSANEENRSNK